MQGEDVLKPRAPAGETRSPQRLRNRCAVQPPGQLCPHELGRHRTAISSVRVLLLVAEPVADLCVAARVGATAADRRDVIDGRRQGVGASAGRVNWKTGILADAAEPVVTFADFIRNVRFDGPVCPDVGSAALILGSGGHLYPSCSGFGLMLPRVKDVPISPRCVHSPALTRIKV